MSAAIIGFCHYVVSYVHLLLDIYSCIITRGLIVTLVDITKDTVRPLSNVPCLLINYPFVFSAHRHYATSRVLTSLMRYRQDKEYRQPGFLRPWTLAGATDQPSLACVTLCATV